MSTIIAAAVQSSFSEEQLLDNLGLLEHGKLKRAAILLFHRNPEKWVTGAYIKIGYFGVGSDLRYQDEIHGSLFIQADRVIELIYLKYMKAMISYDNVTRIETYPLPKAAVREAVYISNDCVFPVGWTVETLMERHRSQPYNPNIANVFFRAGYVETWGRGIEKICEACKKHGVPMPEYLSSTAARSFDKESDQRILYWDFGKALDEKLKMQIELLLNEIVKAIKNREERRNRYLLPLKCLFCRKLLFLESKNINWEAKVWFTKRLNVSSERYSRSNAVDSPFLLDTSIFVEEYISKNYQTLLMASAHIQFQRTFHIPIQQEAQQ